MASEVTDRGTQSMDLLIGGMTCASCANRIERRLNKIEGVQATVNYATERAHVLVPRSVPAATLLAEVEKAGYSAQLPAEEPESPGDDLAGLRVRLLASAALSIPVIAVSMIPALQFPYWQWVAFALATPVVLWAGWPFHRAAAVNLRHGSATMDTLVSVGTLAAYLWSAYALLLGGAGEPGMVHAFTLVGDPSSGAEYVYLEVAAGVTLFLLAGRYFEKRSKRNAAGAITALLELGAKHASVLRNGREVQLPVEDLRVGDVFLVRPGERIATDGIVVEGRAAVDLSVLTGESLPVDVAEGDGVTGGTVNTGGRLAVRATRVGKDTELARMAALVEEAQNGKAQVQRLADRVSGVFVPVVLAASLAVLAFWLLRGATPVFAFTTAVAVLIVACPCALGLATPTALLVGTGRGAQLGLLLRGPEALEASRAVDTVVLDKTGTVTTGGMSVSRVLTAPGADAAEVLRRAAAVEQFSEHPVGRAIAAEVESTDRPAVEDFASIEGKGVEGRVAGRPVLVGSASLLLDRGAAIPPELGRAVEGAAGATTALVAWDGQARGAILVADTIKASSREAVESLKALGLPVLLLTGDSEAAARAVADRVGIEDVVAGVLPAQKLEAIRRLQHEGRRVAMVGDGVNDAAALAQADLGVAMGTGTDVAIAAADITIVGGDLRSAADAIRLARRTLGTIKGNLFWAFAYNVAAIPVAAAGLLNPMLAGAAMAISSIFVVTNSLRLRTFTPRRSAPAVPAAPRTLLAARTETT